MTQEGQGSGPNDAPPPPTSTSWSVPDSDEDDGLMPPFVPGQSRPAREDMDDVQHTGPAADGRVLDTDDAVIDTTDAVAEASGSVPGGADTDLASSPDDDAPFPFDLPVEEEPLPFYGWPPGSSEDQPPEMGLEELEAAPDAPDAPEPVPTPAADAVDRPDAPADPTGDIADRLEALAERIRTEGPDALERDMASLDRFTALVAGVVAGYLAALRN